jgi:hypothetical protein
MMIQTALRPPAFFTSAAQFNSRCIPIYSMVGSEII